MSNESWQVKELQAELVRERKISAALLAQVKKQLQKHANIHTAFELSSELQKNFAETSKQLLHQTNAFESLYQHSADGMLFIENNKFVECNDAIIKMLRCDSKAQVLNLHPSDLSPKYQPDGELSLEKADRMIQRAWENGHNQFQWVHKRIDGEEFWADIILTTMVLNSKSLLHVSWRDISKTKQLEADIINERDVANRANQAKSEFLSKMSHELRTPMNAILGFAQLLELDKDCFNATQQDNINEILHAGEHLLELINEVLDLSKIEAGKMEVSMEHVLLQDVIQPCLNLISAQALERHIMLLDTIDYNKNGQSYCIKTDVMRLKQVMLNLLSNAVKYNCDNGKVVLSSQVIEQQGNLSYLRICVMDTGRGLSQSEIKRLFSPFERMHNDTIEGTGIGLAIAKNLMELMGGTIGVHSTLGKESTFWIDIPLVPPLISKV